MKDILAHLAAGHTLSVDQTVRAFEQIMTAQATPAQVGALLAMIQMRCPTIEEITGAARVMRAKARPVIPPQDVTVIDTCGTGGVHGNTFNVSTAAAIVAAAAGRPRRIVVAKHGNRAATSRSGSSQVLEQLGVKLVVADETQTRCLEEAGVCFCFAPAHHPAMRHVVPVRKEIGFRTIFNVLGPLTNPAGARRQVIGVYTPELTEPLAQVLANLGSEHVMVLHGLAGEKHGLDELITWGPSRISHLRDGQVNTYRFDPRSVGIRPGDPDALTIRTPADSAAIIRRVLAGQEGDARRIVCLNAAAALVVADLAPDLAHAMDLACQAIDSGAARATLDKLIELTRADPTPT